MTPTTPSPISDQAAGEPVENPTTAEYETAIETLRHVIECLRKNGSFTDEEGEATDFLEPLLAVRIFSTAPTTGSAPVAYMHRNAGPWDLSFADDEGKLREVHTKAIPLYDTPPASPTASVPFLDESDMSALMTFHSQMEDHEADGYTVHKETMKRLAELGVVNSLGFGRYETTAFGAWLVEKAFEQDPTLPLRTVAEHNERSALLAASMGGDRT